MKRIGIFAIPVAAALALQGCIFLPVENDDANDPFFFDPDATNQHGDFVEVGHYQANSQTNSYLPPPPNQHCSVDGLNYKAGSACWFFPVMRVY